MSVSPCFAITGEAKQAVELAELSGEKFQHIRVSKLEQFNKLYPERQLPVFYWAQIVGIAGQDDFGIAEDLRLVVSGHALQVLHLFGFEQALSSDYTNSLN